MLKQCPHCDFEGIKKDALRCQQCQQPLTDWLNFDVYAAESYRGALALLGDGKTEEAAECLLRATVFDPEESKYLSALGRVFGQLGRYAEAVSALEQALEINSKDETARLALAVAQSAGENAGVIPAEVDEGDEGGGGGGFGVVPTPAEVDESDENGGGLGEVPTPAEEDERTGGDV